MKAPESDFARSRERLFSICYGGALVLALLGAALFCVLEFTALGRRLSQDSPPTTALASPPPGGSKVTITPPAPLPAEPQPDPGPLEEQHRQLLNLIAEAGQDLAEKTNALASLTTQIHQTGAELKETETSLAALKTQLQAAPAADELVALKNNERELIASLDRLKSELRGKEEQTRKADEERTRKEQEVKQAREDSEKARRERDRLRQEADRSSQDKKRAEEELKRLSDRKRDAARDISKMEGDRAKAESKKRQAENDFNQLAQKQQRAEADLKTLEARRKELESTVWQLTTKKLSQENTPTAPPPNGLRATYFKNRELAGPGITRIDPVIDFDWKDRGPINELGHDDFSVRWEGRIEAPADGRFTLKTLSNDGVRLWVAGKMLIDQWNLHGPTEHEGTIELQAGQRYDLKMEYFEAGGTAVARLAWNGPGGAKGVVPASRLFPR